MRKLLILALAAPILALTACEESTTPVDQHHVIVSDGSGTADYRQAYEACSNLGGQVVTSTKSVNDGRSLYVTCAPVAGTKTVTVTEDGR